MVLGGVLNIDFCVIICFYNIFFSKRFSLFVWFGVLCLVGLRRDIDIFMNVCGIFILKVFFCKFRGKDLIN